MWVVKSKPDLAPDSWAKIEGEYEAKKDAKLYVDRWNEAYDKEREGQHRKYSRIFWVEELTGEELEVK